MSAGPLRQVLTAIEQGASSTAAIARSTGLARDVVEASIEHLVRLGRLDSGTLVTGCPDDGCGTCASAGCGARVVTLTLRPR